MDELIPVSRAPVDDLHLLKVHKYATRHGLAALVVILTGRKDGEDTRALTDRNAFGMGLVGPHDIAETLLLQEVGDSLMSKANGSSTPQALPETRVWVNPTASCSSDATRDLLVLLTLMFVRRVYAGNLGDGEDVLYATLTAYGPGYAPVDAENVLVDNRTQWDAVEHLVGLLPYPVPHLLPESLPALMDVGPLAIVLLPTVNVPSLVVPPEKEHFVWKQ
eukprot:CAMPEP_0118654956 /NCGR_PEP_ID=MMETSP0785-20121206/12665_1 /TAXON_ID=91992 /ORGANISM="Bolidomonas pacifica, Strain CCMP 1866" /LENGTH=219 /DNA_ID=CAMNT_0006547649 /DNA_START=215 /DNA_END=875 /DNA_ORIENTATION=-